MMKVRERGGDRRKSERRRGRTIGQSGEKRRKEGEEDGKVEVELVAFEKGRERLTSFRLRYKRKSSREKEKGRGMKGGARGRSSTKGGWWVGEKEKRGGGGALARIA